ncbi:MAG: AraC family transcriptional regulator [Acidobacteriota bacterium]|nr:AraC family transcriptional regulator [Acidobacteriota bacterium]
MKVDVLSEVLRGVRLKGAVFFDFDLSSPWVLEAPPSREIAGRVMPGAERVIEYHLMARGSGWGHAVGEEPIRLREGDLICFPQGDPHVLSSAPGLRDRPDLSRFVRPATFPVVYDFGGGGSERARIVCCFMGIDERPYNPLLAALPKTIHLGAPDASTRPGSGWLGGLLTIAARESTNPSPGGQNVLERLSELLFVEAIRRYVDTLPENQTGWLAGLRDPIIGEALSALHADPAEAWTVERLARSVGVSRSVLAERFTELVGQPPMQYLALWRMQLASRLLAEGGRVAAVSASAGYESEAAFSRAFKKLMGQSPAAWRRGSERSS